MDIPNLAVAAPSTIGNNAVTPNTNAGLQTVTPEHPLILRATYISDGTISSGVLLNSVSANLKTAPLASLKAIFNPSLLQGKWVPIFDSLWSDVSSLKTYTLSLTKNSLLLAGGCNEYRSSYATTGNNIVFSKVVHGVAQCTTNHDSYLSQAIFKLTKFV